MKWIKLFPDSIKSLIEEMSQENKEKRRRKNGMYIWMIYNYNSIKIVRIPTYF